MLYIDRLEISGNDAGILLYRCSLNESFFIQSEAVNLRDMKKFLSRLWIAVLFMIGTVATADAQFVVKIRPSAPVIVRAGSPSPRHIWVDGEWVWRGGGYQYVNGYWVVPAGRGTAWVPGHWKQTRRGWVWKPGHWRRR
jgi:hypothetical protein